MKTMKKLLAAVLATVMLLGVTACGNKNDTPAADGDNTGTTSTTVLKMGHVYSETYPMHLAMLAMADEVYEKTGVATRSRSMPTPPLATRAT